MGIPKACLFDLDGLLLDTEPLHSRAWNEAASHFGCPLDAQRLMGLRGRRRLDCAAQVRDWIAESTGQDLASDDLLAIRQPIAERLLTNALPMRGAMELVQRCSELGIPMALATSSSCAAVAMKIAPHPWLNAIRIRVHGDDPELKRGKPEPDVFLLAAERLGLEAGLCWAFEDSPAGATAALRAGCSVYVVPPPHLEAVERQQLFPGVERFLNSLEDVQF
jgi:beta-phosphoglucomutase-like phosphatase (HAD superfamily)